jgi:hypothetical protein
MLLHTVAVAVGLPTAVAVAVEFFLWGVMVRVVRQLVVHAGLVGLLVEAVRLVAAEVEVRSMLVEAVCLVVAAEVAQTPRAVRRFVVAVVVVAVLVVLAVVLAGHLLWVEQAELVVLRRQAMACNRAEAVERQRTRDVLEALVAQVCAE